MYVLFKINKKKFSTEQLLNQRVKFTNKLSFKNCKYIQYKYTLSSNLVNNLSKHGKTLRNYKLFNLFYVNYITQDIYKLPDNNEFKHLFFIHDSFKDINRTLCFKIFKTNPLFNLKILKKKRILYYLPKQHRISIVLHWVSSLIKLNTKNYNNISLLRYYPLKNVISNNSSSNKINLIKLKIYKHKFLKGE